MTQQLPPVTSSPPNPSLLKLTPYQEQILGLLILNMLVTPYSQTKAFKLGIIDQHGNPTKKAYNLKTKEEQDAYGILDRLVFRLKHIIEKVPAVTNKFNQYSTALKLVKEHYETGDESLKFETRFISEDVEVTDKDVEVTEKFFSNKYIKPFKLFAEEMGAAAAGGGDGGGAAVSTAPANNIAVTPGIEQPPGARLFKKIQRRNKNGTDR